MTRRGAPLALLAAIALIPACSPKPVAAPTTLRLWAFGREGEVLQELVAGFEQENPGIRVRVQQIPWTAAHEKLLTAYVGDATPDLAQLGNSWIAEFTALGALAPLDSLVRMSREVDSAAYFHGIWMTNVVNGRLYGVPWYVDTRVIFYRKDILKRAGYDSMPQTWDGWEAAMRSVKREVGDGRYAIFLPTNEWVQPIVFGMQTGSGILKNDGRFGAFADPPFRRGFEFYLSLFKSGLAPSLSNVDMANPNQEFARGRFAMWITGPWQLGEFRRRLPAALQQEWGTAALPGPSGAASGVSFAGGSSLVVFRASKDEREAWKVVEYLSRPEQQTRFYQLTGDLPARETAWKSAGLIDDPLTRAFWVQLHRVTPLPPVPEAELIVTRVSDYAEQVIRGGRPVGAALQALDVEVDRILEKRRWILARAESR
jgi:multiple sugar transport system substrate-binding protein